MGRERLPNRRQSETFEFSFEGMRYVARRSEYGDGRPAEVFLGAAKRSSSLDIIASDTAILISFALQHGVSLERLASAMLRDATGAPQGIAGALCDELLRSRAP